MWNVKQKRCYQRIMSGLSYSDARNRVVRFLTLTSSTQSERDIQTDFRVLKMRIKRRYGEFEYIKIRTNEGNGVLHILYVGGYIPQRWISKNWKEIHQSPIVDIRSTSRNKGLGRYVVSQYLSDQRCSFLRYSWSWGFVYRGFVKYWKWVRLAYNKNAVEMWNLHLSGEMIRLDGKFLKPPPDVYFVTFEQTMMDLSFFDHYSNEIPSFFARLYQKCDWIKSKKLQKTLKTT